MPLNPKWKVFNLFCSLLLTLGAILGTFLNLSFPLQPPKGLYRLGANLGTRMRYFQTRPCGCRCLGWAIPVSVSQQSPDKLICCSSGGLWDQPNPAC